MPNEEMMRPCTLWGHTFDATKVIQILSSENHIVVCVEDNNTFMSPYYDECVVKSMQYLQEAITTIADALNAPVLAKEAVLKDLPNDAKAIIDNQDNPCVFPFIQKSSEGWWGCLVYSMEDEDFLLRPLSNTDRIKAHNDPKTAGYLRQFTLQGVRSASE